MKVSRKIVSENMHKYKCPYSMNPVGICIHNTANDAPAINEVNYMSNNTNKVSFHIAVDDKEAIQCIEYNRNAFASGDGSGPGNRKHIHIEICYSKSGGEKFLKAEKNAAKVTADLLKKFNLDISAVKTHNDFSSKYCPHRTLDMGWQRFIKMVAHEMDERIPSGVTRTMYKNVVGSFTKKSGITVVQRNLKEHGFDSFTEPYKKDGIDYIRIIAGSYTEMKNAEIQKKRLAASGFGCFIDVYNIQKEIVENSMVKIASHATKYATGENIPSFVKDKTYRVDIKKNDRVLLSSIISWVYLSDLELIE